MTISLHIDTTRHKADRTQVMNWHCMRLSKLVLRRRSWDDVIILICDLFTKSKLQAVSVWLAGS